ncbi:two-component regulator propeller domain-containing protein [Marinoscillum furvescens]|uniref:histidine kinase n=1 Tax=Marinoscillum furvescens DSM 4134 TaxID=1122208 RepID=A0A3D9L1P5_MARFU|nr:two-component regulator propeller domain-containing protein [Marinoscillum furvescens]RED97015.1 signal transduction histidine kinase [Marinoscillum furvescens DSM 4134]
MCDLLELWIKRSLCLIVICAYQVSAQPDPKLFTQYKFHRLNEADGLTNNVVTDIVQDTLGMIWVGTEDGLFRFEGEQFRKFGRIRNDVRSLPNNMVYKVEVDDQNRVWALTENGIGIYSYETDVIERFLPEKITGPITSMTLDADGNRYFNRFYGGVWKVSPEGKLSAFTLVDPEDGRDLSKMGGILEVLYTAGAIWMEVGDHGLARKDLASGDVRYYHTSYFTEADQIHIYSLYLDRDELLWVTTDRGLYREYRTDDGKTELRSVLGALPADDLMSIQQDTDGTLWLGTRQHGMYAFDPNANDPEQTLQNFAPTIDHSGISHRTISKIYQDVEGYLWLGTHNGGINVFNPAGEKVRIVTNQYNNPSSISYQNVWGIDDASSGYIWVGTDGKGLNLLDQTTGQIRQHELSEALDDKAILAVMEDSRSRLWIGTYASGVYCYELPAGRLHHFRKGMGNNDLMVNDIRCFHETDQGEIYLGANNGGLYTYDKGRVRHLTTTSYMDVRAITSSPDGRLWLGTFNHGLVSFEPTTGRVKEHSWTHNQDNIRNVVFDIYNDGTRLWLATQHHGLLSYHMMSENFEEYYHLEGMADLSISGLTADSQRRLWLASNQGVVAFDPDSKHVRLIQKGFQTGHFNYGSAYTSSRGYIAFGGINGLNLFYPEELLSRQRQPHVVFNELSVLNATLTPVNSQVFEKDRSIFLTDRLELSHTDNIFTLSVAQPGFQVGEQYQLLYRLDGYESRWQNLDATGKITYKNLSPGKYTLQVKDAYEGQVLRELRVVVNPPWWRTWTAYTLFVLVALTILWKIVSFSKGRVLLMQKLRFEKEQREKEQLAMQEKLRFYTNFSHELKTPLTLITGPVGELLKNTSDPKQRNYLSMIRKNTVVLERFINRILEFRKIELNKTNLNVGLHDLKILAQEEAESFAYLASERGVRFGFYCESELEVWVDIEKIQIVLNNLLSNAFKFTGEGKSIKLGVFTEENELVIEVKDEGRGIAEKELSEIFTPFYQASNSAGSGGSGIGLALCKSFVELHGGRIQVTSNPSLGTQFLVYLPLGKAHLEQMAHVRFVEVEGEKAESSLVSIADQQAHTEVTDTDQVILILDDNRDISRYVGSLFDQNFKVLSADNGTEALELAVQNIPDIIISDMMMPGMDGLEFCRSLKDNIATSHIPVIMLTAKSSSQAKLEGFEVGAEDYITKPFNADLLVARVNNILKNRKLLELRYSAQELIGTSSTGQAREAEFVLKVESVILERLSESAFNVPDLCAELGMSQTSLYRKIKSITGMSIQLFIRKIRIKRAAQLLLTEDSTVSEIAFALDFSDLKYFRKCFKEQYEMTPSEYKNAHRESIENP